MNKITPLIFLWFICTPIWAVESFPPLVPEGEQLASSPEELEKLIEDSNVPLGWVTSVAYSPDGQQLASSSWDNTVRVWKIATGKELRRLEGYTDDVNSVAYSPDGQQLASSSWDNTVRVWKIATGKELRRLDGHTDDVNSVVYSPDGQQLASSSSDNTVRVWEIKTGETQ
jgi:WD40 repeat protein